MNSAELMSFGAVLRIQLFINVTGCYIIEGAETQKMLLAKLNVRTQMSAHEFVEFFNEYIHSELDLMNGLTVNDFLWLRKHITKRALFDTGEQLQTARLWLSLIDDVREGVDVGTFVNLIKSIYAIREHRDTMVKASIENPSERLMRCFAPRI